MCYKLLLQHYILIFIRKILQSSCTAATIWSGGATRKLKMAGIIFLNAMYFMNTLCLLLNVMLSFQINKQTTLVAHSIHLTEYKQKNIIHIKFQIMLIHGGHFSKNLFWNFILS